MAYRNSDGRITIDEAEALSDVRKTGEAEEILRRTADQLRQLLAEAQSYEGETVNAILEKATEMLQRTEKLIQNLEETQNYTRRVVEHYKLVDEACKQALENQAAGGSGV